MRKSYVPTPYITLCPLQLALPERDGETSQIVADKRVFNSISHLTWKSVLVTCGHFHKIRVPGRIFVLAVFLKPGFYEGRNTDVVKEAAGTFACKVTCYPPAWMDRRVQRREGCEIFEGDHWLQT